MENGCDRMKDARWFLDPILDPFDLALRESQIL